MITGNLLPRDSIGVSTSVPRPGIRMGSTAAVCLCLATCSVAVAQVSKPPHEHALDALADLATRQSVENPKPQDFEQGRLLLRSMVVSGSEDTNKLVESVKRELAETYGLARKSRPSTSSALAYGSVEFRTGERNFEDILELEDDTLRFERNPDNPREPIDIRLADVQRIDFIAEIEARRTRNTSDMPWSRGEALYQYFWVMVTTYARGPQFLILPTFVERNNDRWGGYLPDRFTLHRNVDGRDVAIKPFDIRSVTFAKLSELEQLQRRKARLDSVVETQTRDWYQRQGLVLFRNRWISPADRDRELNDESLSAQREASNKSAQNLQNAFLFGGLIALCAGFMAWSAFRRTSRPN